MNRDVLLQILQVKMRLFVMAAILLLAAVGLQLFITAYQEPRLEKVSAAWTKHRDEEKRGVAQVDRGLLYKNGIADLDRFRARIYPKAHFARFIGELYDMASRDALELSAITYKPSTSKEEQLISYAMTLTVGGRYPNLKRFIGDLGRSGNILTIDSVAMTASGATTDAVQLQVMITAYFKAEAQ